MFRCWQQGANYDVYIDKYMRHCRCLQNKRCIKLNNNEATPKHDKYGYNPAHKFDFIWRALVNNVNALKKEVLY